MTDPNTEIENDLDDLDEPEIEPKGKETLPKSENDELRSAMAELAGTVKTLATPKEKPEPELTQEQKNELWAVYDPKKSKPDFMKKFFRLNPDATPEEEAEAEQLFKDMHSGMMKQAMTGARNLVQIELSKLMPDIERFRGYMTQQEAVATRSRFNEAYPALTDKRFSKIITATAKDLASGEYASESEFFKALAEGAAETIKGVLPDFDLGASQTTTKKSAGTSPRLSRTSVGGTGGTGGGTKQTALSVKGDATDEFLDD